MNETPGEARLLPFKHYPKLLKELSLFLRYFVCRRFIRRMLVELFALRVKVSAPPNELVLFQNEKNYDRKHNQRIF